MRDFIKDFGPTFISLFAILLSLVSTLLVYSNSRITIKQKQQEEERKEIHNKLNYFYGPFRQCLAISLELYERFTYAHQEGVRTLVLLLQGKALEANDKILMEQILEVEEQMTKLILEQSGLVDNEELLKLLSIAATHFRLIRLAYKGVLQGEPERFASHVFPRELTPKIEAEIKRLKQRLHELNTEVDIGPFAQTLAKIRSWFRHVEADERGLDLRESDYHPRKIVADLQTARLTLESIEDRLLRLRRGL